MELSKQNQIFVSNVKEILENARQKAYTAVNSAMVEAYWLVGKYIVEEEQNGQERAEYGTYLLKILSLELSKSFGKGFDERELRKIRQLYLTFPIRDTMRPELGWSHYRLLIRVSNPDARNYYFREAADNTWTVRTLDRNISTQYYERLLLSQIEAPVKAEMTAKTADYQADKFEFIKNPSVLEFLNLPANTGFTEKELERAIINHLQQFLLELGKGYAFVAQQQRMRTENKDYFIDLVFYNFILKCFVLIDLKTDRITHQDVGQMDMYVRMYDERKRNEGDNPTIGIVLCSETDQDIARYSILNGNEQIFATKYKLFLPTEAELRAEIEREKMILRLQMGEI